MILLPAATAYAGSISVLRSIFILTPLPRIGIDARKHGIWYNITRRLCGSAQQALVVVHSFDSDDISTVSVRLCNNF